jgi:hypothetical protein
MAEKKEKGLPRKQQDLFRFKTKPTGEVKEIKFNSVTINYIDGGMVLVHVDGENPRTVFLTPMDAKKLIDFLQEYVDQLAE